MGSDGGILDKINFGTVWPLILSVVITLMCLFYVWELLRSYKRRYHIDLTGVEITKSGDVSIEGFAGDSKAIPAMDVRVDSDCYDEFYSKIYDALVQPQARAAMEVKLPLEWMEENQNRDKSKIRVADIGSGTGLHVELFAREGVHSVIGYDKSEAMVAQARKNYPDREFVVGDATVPTMAAADQYDLITLNYFTVYMVPDRLQLLRNIYLWLAPGGVFACHIVNKHKFDPVLESASPFVGFSVQKYADDRITKSEVFFDEFEYTGDFQLHGSRGTYVEEFLFKNGRSRKHEQQVWMPNIDVLTKEITDVGFKLMHHTDLTPIGYEYMYLFFFQK
jgi:SAM-dependent methyltransferase